MVVLSFTVIVYTDIIMKRSYLPIITTVTLSECIGLQSLLKAVILQ